MCLRRADDDVWAFGGDGGKVIGRRYSKRTVNDANARYY